VTGCCDDREWLEARIAAKKALVLKYEAALDALSTGAQTYSLDTGQTRQTVTKANLTEVRNALSQLEADISTLQARLGCGQVQVRPAW
jgi:hypothetical protein